MLTKSIGPNRRFSFSKMRALVFFALCLMLAICWIYFFRKTYASQKATSPASPLVFQDAKIDTSITVVKTSPQYNDPDEHQFNPSSEYAKFPQFITGNLVFNPEVKNIMRLDTIQWTQLKELFASLLETAGSIQSTTALVSTSIMSGNQLIYLKPDPKAWGNEASEFAARLSGIVGEKKARFILKVSQKQLALITGDFGKLPRTMEFIDTRADRIDQDEATQDWHVILTGGSDIGNNAAVSFPEQFGSEFRNSGTSTLGHLQMNLRFNEENIPSFLSPFVIRQSDADVKSP